MTGTLQFTSISIIGVVAATFVGQFISAMWFGPLFNKQWTKYCGWEPDQIKKYMSNQHTKAVWGSLVETLIAQIVLAFLLHNLQITSIVGSIVVGTFVWAGFMATVGINEVLWHGMKIQFYVLNQASYLVRTVAMAAIYSFIAYRLEWIMSGGIVKCDVSIVGILLGALTGHIIHAIWYMKLFTKPFVKYYGRDEEDTKKKMGEHKGMGLSILGSFIGKIIFSVVFAIIAHNAGISGIEDAIKLAVLVWLGFMATVCLNEVLWHGERIQFYLINQGCYVVSNIAAAVVYTLVAF